MSKHSADLIVVGAGPAGLAAAAEAARLQLRTILLDENSGPGGRIWQGQPIPLTIPAAVETHYGAGVWAIEPDLTVFWTEQGTARSVQGRRILLATGTTERPLPVPGWTLPGVMTVGAAQIALKTGGLLPHGNTWIAGQGPLTLLYAAQALRAGGRIAGMIDLSDPAARWRAAPCLASALPDFRKGLGWMREIRRIPRYRASSVRAEGNGRLERVTFRIDGKERSEPADLLLLHDGVIPSIQLTGALGCAHVWENGYWRPLTDAWGATSVPGIAVAGDGAGIAGAEAAIPAGRLAALGCAHDLGTIDTASRDRQAAPLRKAHARATASRRFIDTLYPPLRTEIDDATLVCRCEEVTAAEIRAAVKTGCQGLNQLKAFTRCGMGACQSRMCGPVAAAVFAAARCVPLATVQPFRTRFPTRPLTVGELASASPWRAAPDDATIDETPPPNKETTP